MAAPYNVLAGITTVPKPKATKQKTWQELYGAGGGGGAYQPWTQDTGWNQGGQAPGSQYGLNPNERGVAGQGSRDFIFDPIVGNPNVPIPGPPNRGDGGIIGAVDPNTNRPGSVWAEQPGLDYRGILDAYTSDWRSRINAQLGAAEAQRLSQARGLINKLGVRNPSAFLGQVGKYGLTAQDLADAEANPWSELKALEQQKATARGQGFAQARARGGFRSGGTARLAERIEEERARREAQATQEALDALGQGQSQLAQQTLGAWDEFERGSQQYGQQLAQMYAPRQVEAQWNDQYGGYVANGKLYDQTGKHVRNL